MFENIFLIMWRKNYYFAKLRNNKFKLRILIRKKNY